MPNSCEPFTCTLLACMSICYCVPKIFTMCKNCCHQMFHKKNPKEVSASPIEVNAKQTSFEEDADLYLPLDDTHIFEPRPSRPHKLPANVVLAMAEVHAPLDYSCGSSSGQKQHRVSSVCPTQNQPLNNGYPNRFRETHL